MRKELAAHADGGADAGTGTCAYLEVACKFDSPHWSQKRAQQVVRSVNTGGLVHGIVSFMTRERHVSRDEPCLAEVNSERSCLQGKTGKAA